MVLNNTFLSNNLWSSPVMGKIEQIFGGSRGNTLHTDLLNMQPIIRNNFSLQTEVSKTLVKVQKLHNPCLGNQRSFNHLSTKMAAKRISQSSINWVALAERVPEHQRPLFAAFKTKSDTYLRRVKSLPEAPPKIDWGLYKAKIPVAGMVAEFEKQYSVLSIPYPADTVSSQIDAQANEIKKDIEKFKLESSSRIEEYKKQLAHIASLIPYDQMTMEDFRDSFPQDALDAVKKPTFWPHNPEEQLDHQAGNEPAPEKH